VINDTEGGKKARHQARPTPKKKKKNKQEKNILRIESVQKARHMRPLWFYICTNKSPQVIKRVTDLQNHSNNTSSEGQAAESSTDNSGTAG
jgi:hypothetical protein